MALLAPYIVRFRPEAPVSELDRVLERFALQPYHIFSEAIRGFAVLLPEPVVNILRREELGVIETIERDLEVRPFFFGGILDFFRGFPRPGAPSTPPPQAVPEGLQRIGGLESSANIGRGGPAQDFDVDIFVLDSGVQSDHPDLHVVDARSFVPLEREPTDLNGHGTLVAGVTAARDNGSHTVGVVPGARVHGYKVLGRTGMGSLSNIIAAVEQVIRFKRNAPQSRVVMNLSLGADAGGPAYTSLDFAIREAVVTHGITAVVAAGNESVNAINVTPAHCREAITVGSFGQTGDFSSFSNFGAVVDILAPGENVLSTARESKTGRASGTSFAAPYVAGAAALYLARHPEATPLDVLQGLRDLAQDPANPTVRRCPPDTTDQCVFVRQL